MKTISSSSLIIHTAAKTRQVKAISFVVIGFKQGCSHGFNIGWTESAGESEGLTHQGNQKFEKTQFLPF